MYTILLLENDKNQLSLYEQELRLEGYEVITATDGKDVVNKVQEQPFDLVVIDKNLPETDCIKAMGKILSKNKDIPIIVNTTDSNYKNNFISLVASAYVVKSSDLTELKYKIRNLLAHKDLNPNKNSH